MFKNSLNDFRAGLVVFLVALPLCLGIALASNAPLMSGLIAGIIGGVVVGALSGSHTSVSGPAAGLAAVVASQIVSLGSFELFLHAVFLAGIIQILFGLFKGGFIASFFPNCVIKGLLFSIGLLLILKQIPHMFGHDSDPSGDFSFFQVNQNNTFSELAGMLNDFHFGAALIGILSFAYLMFASRSRLKLIASVPAPLVVVVFGVLLNLLFVSTGSPLSIEDNHLVLLPSFSDIDLAGLIHVPVLSNFVNHEKLFFAAITIAIVASLETLLNVEAVDNLDPKQRHSPADRELVAQGVGNVASGLLGGLPITSVIVRSTVNISNNNETKLSAIFHGVLLFAFVAYFPNLLNQIPLSCLAAILIATGLKLASPQLAVKMYKTGSTQMIPFAITIFGIILIDLLTGAILGLVSAVLIILYENFKRPFKSYIQHDSGKKQYTLELPHQISFLAKASLKRELARIPERSVVIIDGHHTVYLDVDIWDMLQDFKDKALSRDIQVQLNNVMNPSLSVKAGAKRRFVGKVLEA